MNIQPMIQLSSHKTTASAPALGAAGVFSRPASRRSTLRLRALMLAAAGAGIVSSAHAASDAWDGATDSLWSTATNWATDTSAPGAGETATFNGAGSGNTTIDLGAGVSVGSVVFDSPSAAAYTIGAGGAGAQTLSLGNAGAITINSGVTTSQTISSNLSLDSAVNAAATLTNNGSGLLSVLGGINANVASGNGVLNVNGSGNTSISGAITKSGAGSNALFKTGAGTLTLSGGSAWTGAGAVQTAFSGPFTVQEGNLRLNGGTHAVTGELVIGGVVTHGGAGQNAKIQVDAGALNISSWLSVGRGNGTGVATSDLELNNNAVVTAANLSAGFNAGNALNMPRGTITLNGSSSLSVTTSVFLAESAGTNFTLNLNGTSQFTQTATGGGDTRVGSSNGSVGTINVNGGTASFERDLILGYANASTGNMEINSGVVNVANATERWLIIGRANGASGNLTVNGGNLNLNANTDIRFSTTNTAVGTNVVTLNGGAINGGVASIVDLKQNTGATSNSTFHLNGGTLNISQVITTQNTATATAVFNFNGGVLKATTATANFVDLGGALQRANVRNGGALIDSNGFNITIPEPLRHSDVGGDSAIDGGLTKSGAGILTLTGANTYTGATSVNAGTLALGAAGTLVSTGLNIANGAEFDVSSKAAYALGGATVSFGLDAATGGFFDAGAAALDFGGASVSFNFSTSSLVDGQTYNLVDFGSQTGDFASVALTGSSFSGSLVRTGQIWNGVSGAFAFSFDETSGVLSVSAVPEPSAFAALAGLTVLGVVASRRRRR